jgi:hypothetical protein
LFGLDVELQVAGSGEEVLVRDVEVVDAVRAVCFGFDVIAFGVEPVRAARDLGLGILYMRLIMSFRGVFCAV